VKNEYPPSLQEKTLQLLALTLGIYTAMLVINSQPYQERVTLNEDFIEPFRAQMEQYTYGQQSLEHAQISTTGIRIIFKNAYNFDTENTGTCSELSASLIKELSHMIHTITPNKKFSLLLVTNGQDDAYFKSDNANHVFILLLPITLEQTTLTKNVSREWLEKNGAIIIDPSYNSIQSVIDSEYKVHNVSSYIPTGNADLVLEYGQRKPISILADGSILHIELCHNCDQLIPSFVNISSSGKTSFIGINWIDWESRLSDPGDQDTLKIIQKLQKEFPKKPELQTQN
jgi:hypothetical protein